MTTKKRDKLKEDAMLIVAYADRMLNLKKNVEKGDDWETIDAYRMLHLLGSEVAEIAENVVALWHLDKRNDIQVTQLRREILNEMGDALNVMRMMADNAGCFEGAPNPDTGFRRFKASGTTLTMVAQHPDQFDAVWEWIRANTFEGPAEWYSAGRRRDEYELTVVLSNDGGVENLIAYLDRYWPTSWRRVDNLG